jgi:hypothetical protein
MTEETKQWMLGLLTGVVITTLIAIGINQMKVPEPPMEMMPKDIIQAYNMGLKDALRTNPVSLELDQTCLNLWANKQPMEMSK